MKHYGPIFVNWLCKIYNCICEIEEIPACFKQGIIIPIFKDEGRDPLLTKSYRGITLTSVLAKVFEILLLNRMNPIFDEAGVPQQTQTAYRKGVGCIDSIFAGKESISRLTAEGDCVYSCFYDLASAFDTIEFCVLLEQLSHAGVKGKCWRLIKDWHKNLSAQVRLDNHLSRAFQIQRGIRQESVLSPALFNLVMDPLLANLKSRNLGLSVQGLFFGDFGCADDIHTSSTSVSDAGEQVQSVNNFAKMKGLKLCPEKCGVVISGRHRPCASLAALPVIDSVKCLGVWWGTASTDQKSIEEHICKTRGAFFSQGEIGAFHGLLNPHSSRSIVESCVMPILMYGTETWSLNTSLLLKLESFQAEIGKGVLKLPRFTANNVPLMALGWPSM